jgi:predicted porin
MVYPARAEIVRQFSECVSQIVNLKMNFRETTRVPRCQYQDAAFERNALFHQSTRVAVEAATCSTLSNSAPASERSSRAIGTNDNNAVMVAAKYKWDPFKFFAGYEYIWQNNPSNPLGVGASDQGGYT